MELITTHCNKQETLVLSAYAQRGKQPMSTEENKATVRRSIEEGRSGRMPNKPQLEFLFELSVYVAPPLTIGHTPHGYRRIAPLTGGSFESPHLKGEVLPGGGDWLLVRPDGVGEIDARAILQTDDGALIYVTNRGYITNIAELAPRWAAGEQIPHEEYYFVTTPYVETSAAQYAWLQQVVVIGMGSAIPGGVSYQVFAVRQAEEEGMQAGSL